MNNQNTKINTNKSIAIAIAILSVAIMGSTLIPTNNLQFKSKADNTKTVAPQAAPSSSATAVAPAESPVVKATTSNPAITAIKSTDTTISGTAVANSVIELKDGNGNVISCKNSPITADSNGNYSCQLNSPLQTNTIVAATATENGKNTSNPVNVSVIDGTPVPPPSSSAISSTPASSTPAPVYNPVNIDGGLLTFNIPDSLKNPLGKYQYNANLSLPNLGDWKLTPGIAIPGLAGMVPILAQKDDNNYLSTFLSNQTPEVTKKPSTRIVMDQAALDAASGVLGFKPVEVGGTSDLVRIPNFNTPATDDWWYVPKSSIEANGYKATPSDVANVGTDEATIGFYKGNTTAQVTPVADQTLPYSFVLEGTPKSYSPGNAFALNAKASTPENLLNIDNLVKGSTFDNSGYKFALPKINFPKLGLPGVKLPNVDVKGNWWNLWWILPLLLLLALLAFLWWLLRRLFGWGVKEDTSKYSQTYTGVNNNFKKTNLNYTANNTIDTSGQLKTNYSQDLNISKTENIKSTIQTPKFDVSKYVAPIAAATAVTTATYVAPKIEEELYVEPIVEEVAYVAPKYEAPIYEAPVLETPKFEEPSYVANSYETTKYVSPTENTIITDTEEFVSKDIEYKDEVVQKTNYEYAQSSDTSYEAPKTKTMSPAAAAAAAAMMTVAKNNFEDSSRAKSNVSPKAVSKHSMHRDDLKIVEGIGPVIERNLHDAGVLTFQDLANTSEAQIEKILAPITNNFTVFNCSTWAEQAQLAADGKFDELAKLKEELDKGVRR